MYFKEHHLKQINHLLSEEREDSFRRRRKRASIYFSNEDSSLIPDILDSIKNSLNKIEGKKNKKSQKKSQNSFFSTDLGRSDFSIKFTEKTNNIFTDVGNQEENSNESGSEEEEHLKELGERKVEGEGEEEEQQENYPTFEERKQDLEIMGEDVE